MDPFSRSRWRKRIQRPRSLLLLLSVSAAIVLLIVSTSSTSPPSGGSCGALIGGGGALIERRFLWYAPHSGFGNQLSELKNAVLIAAVLNRTLIVPPVLDHHAVALGSCPKFRVSSPAEIRAAVWDHIMDLVRDRRYVSMADIVDLSFLGSIVKTIDFRVFASLWCNLNMENACFGTSCCNVAGMGSLSTDSNQCRSLLSGLQGNADSCVYALERDCRTTVWTYQQDDDETLDPFQPNNELKKKKNLSYVRKRRDLIKALGPGSKAETAVVLAFGSLFSAPYRGSELYIDIRDAPKDARIRSLIDKLESLPFVPEIIDAGKSFSVNRIKVPFLCAQLRLLDGQFKNHWAVTFSALKLKLKSLELEAKGNTARGPINIFVMTDLDAANWTGTYLEELASDSESYKLHTLLGSDELVMEAARRAMGAERGIKSGIFPRDRFGSSEGRACEPVTLPDFLLYVEGIVCSCAELGFVGTAGSTIAESIESMRKHNVCKL